MKRTRPDRAGGWSLVELSVVLLVAGVVGLVLWRVLPLMPEVASGDPAARDLARAEQALLGYALAHSRLPAPVEDHGRRLLPVEALGLPPRLRIEYRVQPQLADAPTNRFVPALPGGAAASPVNGLDLCMELKDVSGATLEGMQGVPVAFALMHLGSRGLDGGDSGFALPGSAQIGDRRVLAVGPGEFASRLACPERISAVRAAARAAHAAADMEWVADRNLVFRGFASDVADMNMSNASMALKLATFDVALASATQVMAILQIASGWPPDPAAMAAGAKAEAKAIALLVTASVNLDKAIDRDDQASAALDTAIRQEEAASGNVDRMQALADQALSRARYLDQAGLAP